MRVKVGVLLDDSVPDVPLRSILLKAARKLMSEISPLSSPLAACHASDADTVERRGACETGNMGVGRGLIRMRRTHVFDAVHATVVPSFTLGQDADHGWPCASGHHPRLPGAELQGQSHHIFVRVG